MIMDEKLKESILKNAKETGGDLDGDIITVGDKKYYVHVLFNQVCEITL